MTNASSFSGLAALSAREAAQRIARRELGVASLVAACLERIAAREPQVGAWAYLDPAAALVEAREMDRRAPQGALFGVPFGVKDLFDSERYPTAYGSPIYAGHRPAADAACVALARQAGALVLGKTVSTEFATFHPGNTSNPHDPRCTPGGSSSGSAAAVADGMVPLALGTQTAGSVIRPAAYCGVVGFKPTFGRICRAGVKPLSESLDTIGVFARDVADAALFAGVLAGREWTPEPLSAPPRIGICRTGYWDRAEGPAHAVFEATVRELAAQRAGLGERPLPPAFDALLTAQAEIMAFEAAQALAHERRTQAAHLSAALRGLLDAGAALAPAAHDANLARVAQARAELAAVFGEFDALLTLSTTGEAPEGLSSTGDPLCNRLWTALGVPCLHLPLARGPRGLPLGVQLIGRPGEDRRLLSVAQWAQQALSRLRA